MLHKLFFYEEKENKQNCSFQLVKEIEPRFGLKTMRGQLNCDLPFLSLRPKDFMIHKVLLMKLKRPSIWGNFFPCTRSSHNNKNNINNRYLCENVTDLKGTFNLVFQALSHKRDFFLSLTYGSPQRIPAYIYFSIYLASSPPVSEIQGSEVNYI